MQRGYLFAYKCHLLITLANSLDPDQARQNVGPDLDPNCLTLMVFLKEFFETVDFEKKISRRQKSMQNYPACKRLMLLTLKSNSLMTQLGLRKMAAQIP